MRGNREKSIRLMSGIVTRYPTVKPTCTARFGNHGTSLKPISYMIRDERLREPTRRAFKTRKCDASRRRETSRVGFNKTSPWGVGMASRRRACFVGSSIESGGQAHVGLSRMWLAAAHGRGAPHPHTPLRQLLPLFQCGQARTTRGTLPRGRTLAANPADCHAARNLHLSTPVKILYGSAPHVSRVGEFDRQAR